MSVNTKQIWTYCLKIFEAAPRSGGFMHDRKLVTVSSVQRVFRVARGFDMSLRHLEFKENVDLRLGWTIPCFASLKKSNGALYVWLFKISGI